ncbi:MAG: DUF4395 family protein [Chloroflexi bacterium]|nr:DUF4395 family protein [Chloroflexota bacterium]
MAQADNFDVSARKFHQAGLIALLVLGFLVEPALSGLGVALVVAAGTVMLVGRYWWPADIFRQFAWRVLEPRGLLKRYDAVEDHATRRVARVLGGAVLLASAPLVAVGQAWAWAVVGAIGVMILLDAAFNFCVLCEVTYRFGRLRPHAEGSAH